MKKSLPLKVRRSVDAAEGWLELGDWESANAELLSMDPKFQSHPEALRVSVEIHFAAKHWETVIDAAGHFAALSPDDSFGPLRLAYALHELKRTKDAWNTLVPVVDKFPDQWVIPYNLACYAAQMGNLKSAREWLTQAFKVGDEKKLKREAMDDPDLAPLWEIGE